MSPFGTVTLGELIDMIARRPADHEVEIGFGYFKPGRLLSYRGYYDHLALGYNGDEPVPVTALLSDLRSAVGKTYHGYKGGEYRMNRDTPVWLANHGEACSTTIIGLYDSEYRTILRVGYEP